MFKKSRQSVLKRIRDHLKHTHTHTHKGGQAFLSVSNKQTHLAEPPHPRPPSLRARPSPPPHCAAEWLLWIINRSGYWRRKALKSREGPTKGVVVKRAPGCGAAAPPLGVLHQNDSDRFTGRTHTHTHTHLYILLHRR